jgi:translation initiation factor eIF-2B subunit delta
MSPELENRIARLEADRESGASEILQEAIAILRDALDGDADMIAVAGRLCAAQPTMASIWNAGAAAVAAREEPKRFMRFTQRVARAPQAVTRFSLALFGVAPSLRLVTISYSRTVLEVIAALAARQPVHVACSEGRPALEGRTLAMRLAALGLPVTFFSDAALGQALAEADAVVVGADAITPASFFNKSGTRMLASAATLQGVPCYVVASRDKFVPREIAGRLHAREGAASDIWEHPPAGITIRNTYFESTPLDLVTGVITDIGVIGAGAVPDVCEAVAAEASPKSNPNR